MKKVLILVEGQTEETFVREVLGPYAWQRGVAFEAKLATTKRVKAGPDFKGGVASYRRVAEDLRRLLGDTSAACVTTMIDYYGLPSDFPGMSTRPAGDCYARVVHVERAFETSIGHHRFVPNLVLHEFEALLFAEPARSSTVFDPPIARHMEEIRDRQGGPEQINEGPQTAPSKHILRLLPNYDKAVAGALAAIEVGLDAIRAACPHFGAWLARIEDIGKGS